MSEPSKEAMDIATYASDKFAMPDKDSEKAIAERIDAFAAKVAGDAVDVVAEEITNNAKAQLDKFAQECEGFVEAERAKVAELEKENARLHNSTGLGESLSVKALGALDKSEDDRATLKAENARLRGALSESQSNHDVCDSCGKTYSEIYWAKDEHWKEVVGHTFGGTRCLSCFEREAKDMGISPAIAIHSSSESESIEDSADVVANLNRRISELNHDRASTIDANVRVLSENARLMEALRKIDGCDCWTCKRTKVCPVCVARRAIEFIDKNPLSNNKGEESK